jgi:hypothetical protein
VEPAAAADVNVPGVMAMDVAPDVVQLKMLVPPEEIPLGLAVNEVMVGLLGRFTVTVTVAVVDPVELVAVMV